MSLLVRAIVFGLLIGMIAANVWPLLLIKLGVPAAAAGETIFLAAYLWWAAGGGPPKSTEAGRAWRFRRGTLHWGWGLVAALSFAATVHAAIVVLFRLVPFPIASFRHGYDFSFIPTQTLRWIAVVFSAASAGICEETGFRGYMQRPIEQNFGARAGILVSSLLFMALHLTKDWATIGMVPIVFGAGVLLGMLAWASQSLVFCMIGHTVMDVGLFAYWWTGIAGDFTARPIAETGVDSTFVIAGATLAAALSATLFAIERLSLSSQGVHGIGSGGAARGKIAGESGGCQRE